MGGDIDGFHLWLTDVIDTRVLSRSDAIKTNSFVFAVHGELMILTPAVHGAAHDEYGYDYWCDTLKKWKHSVGGDSDEAGTVHLWSKALITDHCEQIPHPGRQRTEKDHKS